MPKKASSPHRAISTLAFQEFLLHSDAPSVLSASSRASAESSGAVDVPRELVVTEMRSSPPATFVAPGETFGPARQVPPTRIQTSFPEAPVRQTTSSETVSSRRGIEEK